MSLNILIIHIFSLHKGSLHRESHIDLHDIGKASIKIWYCEAVTWITLAHVLHLGKYE